MSASGTGAVPSQALEGALRELGAWKRETVQRLAAFRRWAIVGRSLDEQTAARLAHLERRLLAERLTIAFVGERARGKSELINAIFFAGLGARLMPSNARRATLCPTEILWDPALPASLRLLPVETREGPRALREHIAEAGAWEEIRLDAAKPETLACACEALSDTLRVSAAQAANLGLGAAQGEGGEVVIPKWRYAIINLPVPVLEDGLVILDTPGYHGMAAEPEVTVQRLPDAAAIVFVLDAEAGVVRGDRELWSELIQPIHGIEQRCYAALNKIDVLRDGTRSETQILAEVDRRVKAAAEALHIAPARVFPLSAKQGASARIHDDRDGLIRSRVYRLAQALAQGVARQNLLDHALSVRAESRVAFAESRALLESRLDFANAQLEEMAAIQGKNQRLVEALARKAVSERGRLERARAMMMGLRTAHNRHVETLSRLLDPAHAREAGARARAGVIDSRFSTGIGEALDHFFSQSRARIAEAIGVIGEARAAMDAARRRFAQDFEIATVEVGDFATQRFLVELERLELACARDFKGAGSMLTRRRATLGALFFDSVALEVVNVFEIAGREARTWMAGFMRPLEAQLQALQEQANTRIEGMGRIQHAETDLIARHGELQALAGSVAEQLRQGEEHYRGLMQLLEAQRPPG